MPRWHDCFMAALVGMSARENVPAHDVVKLAKQIADAAFEVSGARYAQDVEAARVARIEELKADRDDEAELNR